MTEHKIVKRIATIKEWSSTTLELNIVKWGNNSEKYDLRRWEGGKPGRGVTLSKDDLETLFDVIGDELDLFDDGEDDTGYDDEYGDGYDDGDEDDNDTSGVSYGRAWQEEIDYRHIFVHGFGKCRRPDHYSQEKVIAIIQVLRPDRSLIETEVEIWFCPYCNIYYMSEEDFYSLKKKGRLLCQLLSEEEYKNYKRDKEYGNLKPQGILSMIGYNVNATDNYSDEYRQQILSFGIDAGIITLKDATGYLTFFIRMNEGNLNMAEAVSKWRRDRDYLTGYIPGKMRKIKGSIIIKHE